MKKKNPSDGGAQYAGTQPIQHGEIVLSQPELSATKESDTQQAINPKKANDPLKRLFSMENPPAPAFRQDQKPKALRAKLKPIL